MIHWLASNWATISDINISAAALHKQWMSTAPERHSLCFSPHTISLFLSWSYACALKCAETQWPCWGLMTVTVVLLNIQARVTGRGRAVEINIITVTPRFPQIHLRQFISARQNNNTVDPSTTQWACICLCKGPEARLKMLTQKTKMRRANGWTS